MSQSRILRAGPLIVPRRMRVRERHAPPARIGAKLEGWMRWGLIDRGGREVRGGEQHNLILDVGLDMLATYNTSNMLSYLAVGTDNTAPTTSDTQLGSQVARKNTKFTAVAITRTANGVYEVSATWEWDYGEANGNLTEWGTSPLSSGDLWTRELFRDTGGTAVPVTKDSSHKLRMTYVLQVTLSPVVSTAGSFNLADYPSSPTVLTVDCHYLLVKANKATIPTPDLGLFNWLAQGQAVGTGGGYGLYGSGPVLGALVDDHSGDLAYDQTAVTGDFFLNGNGTSAYVYAHDGTPAAYTPGSYARASWINAFANTEANITIRGFAINGGNYTDGSGNTDQAPGYLCDFDTASITKDDLHELQIGMPAVSWARV